MAVADRTLLVVQVDPEVHSHYDESYDSHKDEYDHYCCSGGGTGAPGPYLSGGHVLAGEGSGHHCALLA